MHERDGARCGNGETRMARRSLAELLETIQTLELEELREVQRAVQERLGEGAHAAEEARFHEALIASGVVKEIKPPRAALGERRLIQACGKPVSETIIQERR